MMETSMLNLSDICLTCGKLKSACTCKKKSKHRNVKTELDGITYDSAKEANRAAELALCVLGKKIADLSLQASFKLVVNEQSICFYVADFVYRDLMTGKMVVEDVKSEHTRKLPVYRIKKKLMKACFGIEIVEV
jgi:hypothetical protein